MNLTSARSHIQKLKKYDFNFIIYQYVINIINSKFISNLETLSESICNIGKQFCIEELILVFGTTLSSPLKSYIFKLNSKIFDEEDKQEAKKRRFLRALVTSGSLNIYELSLYLKDYHLIRSNNSFNLGLCKMFTVLKIRTQNSDIEFPENFSVIENFELNDKKVKPVVVDIKNKTSSLNEYEKETKYIWIKSKIPLEGIKL